MKKIERKRCVVSYIFGRPSRRIPSKTRLQRISIFPTVQTYFKCRILRLERTGPGWNLTRCSHSARKQKVKFFLAILFCVRPVCVTYHPQREKKRKAHISPCNSKNKSSLEQLLGQFGGRGVVFCYGLGLNTLSFESGAIKYICFKVTRHS